MVDKKIIDPKKYSELSKIDLSPQEMEILDKDVGVLINITEEENKRLKAENAELYQSRETHRDELSTMQKRLEKALEAQEKANTARAETFVDLEAEGV